MARGIIMDTAAAAGAVELAAKEATAEAAEKEGREVTVA